jgi:hypothetical protein
MEYQSIGILNQTNHALRTQKSPSGQLGKEIGEPFVSRTVFPQFKQRYAIRCETLRQAVWEQPKFGVDA